MWSKPVRLSARSGLMDPELLEVFNMRSSNSLPRTLKEAPGRSQASLTPSGGLTRSGRSGGAQYEICYRPLLEGVAPLSFPCDAEGHVQLDALSDRARESYLYARAVVGREYAAPAVLPCEAH